MYRKVREAKSW